jgi:hypothetical protein
MGQGGSANCFIMRGKDLDITYETTSFSGQPQLIYKRGERSLTFGEKEIRQSSTEIGQQVTVTIEEFPDDHTLTLTLLLPTIDLEGDETSFRTIAILTTHRTSLGGPEMVKGALQTYHSEEFVGTATKVYFFGKP